MRPLSAPVVRGLVLSAALALLLLVQGCALAQARGEYSQAELERMLAPIALYPDPLLSQVLMASTYPVEVVEAARWARANPGLEGEAALRAVDGEDWDPSVKSLVAIPHLLRRMDENLQWTRQLGEAFIAWEPQVMETVQRLRWRARAAGQLVPDERLRISEQGGQIAIEPVDARLVYVPYYDPLLAYGPWWWPGQPPVAWAPWPGYVAYLPRPAFAWGPAITVSAGFFFGAVDWPRRHLTVVRVQRSPARTLIVHRDAAPHAPAAHPDGPALRWVREQRWRADAPRVRSEPVRALPSRFEPGTRGTAGTRDEARREATAFEHRPQPPEPRIERRPEPGPVFEQRARAQTGPSADIGARVEHAPRFAPLPRVEAAPRPAPALRVAEPARPAPGAQGPRPHELRAQRQREAQHPMPREAQPAMPREARMAMPREAGLAPPRQARPAPAREAHGERPRRGEARP
ncbi:MAG: DUF3300 domain-containing protein [Burkholderiales bacterium]|nr:DUF3300 domain-containing protein [Burkholderiales bacterium]